MYKDCPRAADSFLLAVGELGFWPSVRALLHTLVCKACRLESRRLRQSANAISAAAGTSTAAAISTKMVLVKVATVALSAITVAGMWYAGREAVGAAMASSERQELRQTTFEPEEMPSKPTNH